MYPQQQNLWPAPYPSPPPFPLPRSRFPQPSFPPPPRYRYAPPYQRFPLGRPDFRPHRPLLSVERTPAWSGTFMEPQPPVPSWNDGWPQRPSCGMQMEHFGMPPLPNPEVDFPGALPPPHSQFFPNTTPALVENADSYKQEQQLSYNQSTRLRDQSALIAIHPLPSQSHHNDVASQCFGMSVYNCSTYSGRNQTVDTTIEQSQTPQQSQSFDNESSTSIGRCDYSPSRWWKSHRSRRLSPSPERRKRRNSSDSKSSREKRHRRDDQQSSSSEAVKRRSRESKNDDRDSKEQSPHRKAHTDRIRTHVSVERPYKSVTRSCSRESDRHGSRNYFPSDSASSINASDAGSTRSHLHLNKSRDDKPSYKHYSDGYSHLDSQRQNRSASCDAERDECHYPENEMSYLDNEADAEKELEEETLMWLRCSPADLYYQRSPKNPLCMVATPKLVALLDRFENEIVKRGIRAQNSKPRYEPPFVHKDKANSPKQESSDSESAVLSDGESSGDDDRAMMELERKRKHPDRLHEELWFNDAGEVNDGPLCRCSMKARRSGIRHGIYPGEDHVPPCDPLSNNADRLFHYRITMSPHTNFLTKAPTVIRHDEHEFIFEGFSLLSHYKLMKLPTCKVIRFNIEYIIHYIEEKFPENFTIRGLELFYDFLYNEILELLDFDLKAHNDPTGCKRFHFFPRFVRALKDNGKEILSMNEVLSYLLSNSKPLVEESDLTRLMKMPQHEYQNLADNVKGMIVTYPGMKPSSLRVDQLDRDLLTPTSLVYPEIVHFGIRPVQLCYAGNPFYQKVWRDYVKYRHLLANKPKVAYQDRHKLMQKELRLQEMRTKSSLKRDVTVVISSKGFYHTGIMCDIVQHAMLVPVLVCHLRFHHALHILEEKIGHRFEDRYLLQLALTHPSYRENYGTNPDHARNSLTNCGIRHPEYGDRRIQYINTRKRGITTLINIMSRFGKHEETTSNINHNERLEFLGDAVVEFLTSIHLFHLFPEIEEGGLATYRAAIVQNQHLAILAKKLQLEKFMLYAHGSDLCHDLELRHAMANCFEALMGALFLDGGVEAADRVFSQTLFSEKELLDIWVNYPLHPIQEQLPGGDRQWIESVPLLSKLLQFETQTGIEFMHIRLLARAFTHRSVGYNNLTLGSNQRLEFLGDTVLQLVASEYLYKFFPEHHEGHLSLLRSSLVNNKTQSVVCDDLGMVDYAIYAYPKGEFKIKDRADLLEAFLGALYVDKGLEYCRVFCQVCFFPRLQDFIMNQDWNDPKSKLQQCCLTLRTMDGGEPDIPIYKVIECKGPTNTRVFTVAVYFRGKRLAKGSGHSIQRAEMSAASKALESSKADLFPQLSHQRRVIERSVKKHRHQCAQLDPNVCKVSNMTVSQEDVKHTHEKHSSS